MGGQNRLLFAALLLLLCVSACLQGARCSSREGGGGEGGEGGGGGEGGSGGGGYVRNAVGGGGYFSGAAGGTISNWRDPLGQGALRVCGAALALAAAALL
ncbi:hypothetical protein SETIT_8G047800v2 [Setaria italica]|uniref:Uncharacterized protein n=1 Tax=Setaria italica TaxID=4555 RepID=A0A368S4A2_SETIT|nr:hypothetical protein SETIT_8G047800v2 [Setaria italica]